GRRRSPTVVCRRGDYSKSVRVQEHLLGVKPISAVRVEGPVRPIGVHLARLKVRHKDMPVVMRTMFIGIERDDPCRLGGILVIEQKQLKQERMLREYAEVAPAGENRPAERRARTRCNITGGHRPHHATIGLTFQMSRQYSRIERSDEKRPTRAQLRMEMRVEAFWSEGGR